MMGTNTFWHGGGWTTFHIHMLFGVVLVVGVILLVAWAIKSLKPKQLASWALWLTLIGSLGVLLTASWGGNSWTNMMGQLGNSNSWQEMSEHLGDEDHSGLTTAEDWEEHMAEEMQEHMGVK